MEIHLSKIELLNYLQQSGVEESDIKSVGSIFDECDSVDGKSDGYISSEEGLNDFTSKGLSLLSHLGRYIGPFIENKIKQPEQRQMSDEEIKIDRKQLAKKIETTYKNARDKLVNKLQSGYFEFTNFSTGQKFDASNLIKYLNELSFKASKYGGAQAINEQSAIEVNTTPSDGKNPPPLSKDWNCSEAEAMKILLHEALHCEYMKQKWSPGFNTQEEELFCEKNAILLAAQMSDQTAENTYGVSYKEMADNPKLLETNLQKDFINNGYAHRPKNASGDINIEGYEIKSGNKVYINGNEVGVVGAPPNGCLFDELNNDDIRAAGQVFGDNNKVVMSSQPGAIPLVIKNDSGEIVFEAYLINPNPQKPNPKNFGL